MRRNCVSFRGRWPRLQKGCSSDRTAVLLSVASEPTEGSANLVYWAAVFRRKFNHFYRVRRGPVWQDAFFGLLQQVQQERLTFRETLTAGDVGSTVAMSLLANEASYRPVALCTAAAGIPDVDVAARMRSMFDSMAAPTRGNRTTGLMGAGVSLYLQLTSIATPPHPSQCPLQ